MSKTLLSYRKTHSCEQFSDVMGVCQFSCCFDKSEEKKGLFTVWLVACGDAGHRGSGIMVMIDMRQLLTLCTQAGSSQRGPHAQFFLSFVPLYSVSTPTIG